MIRSRALMEMNNVLGEVDQRASPNERRNRRHREQYQVLPRYIPHHVFGNGSTRVSCLDEGLKTQNSEHTWQVRNRAKV